MTTKNPEGLCSGCKKNDMKVIYNFFSKSKTSKTGYQLFEGEPIIHNKIYVVNPSYVHSRSPAFSLVAKSKHISSFYPVANGFIGDFQKQTLLIFFNGDSGLDLFLIPGLSPMQTKQSLVKGDLNEILFRARNEVNSFSL